VRTRPIPLGLAGLGLTLSVVLVGHGGAPAPAAKDVMQGELKYLVAELAKAKVLKKAERKARMSALMLAAAAKTAAGKDNEAALGYVATKALEVVKLMDAGEHAQAKKIIAELASGKHPGGKMPAINYKDHLELEFVMRIFSSEKVGGFGFEKMLEDLVEHKGALNDAESQKVAHFAAKVALIGDIALHYPPEEEKGDKTKKNWKTFAEDMNKAARVLQEAAAAKKGDQIGKLADHLGKTCTACHDVFR
jgi:hypothetical protein